MYDKLKKLAENRAKYFHDYEDQSGWYEGSDTYFNELPTEIREALDESKENNSVYLEDELGDVLWDYLMLLNTLKIEDKITSVDAVIKRAYDKFSERVGKDGKKDIGDQGEWNKIKRGQKVKRQKEHDEKYST